MSCTRVAATGQRDGVVTRCRFKDGAIGRVHSCQLRGFPAANVAMGSRTLSIK